MSVEGGAWVGAGHASELLLDEVRRYIDAAYTGGDASADAGMPAGEAARLDDALPDEAARFSDAPPDGPARGEALHGEAFSLECAPMASAYRAANAALHGTPAPRPADLLADVGTLLEGLDEPFSPTLLALIDASGMTDAEVYHRANVSRQLFAKIRANRDYRPTKPTAVAFALALGLDLVQAQDLLARAGHALSRSSRFDVIVMFFLERGIHDVLVLNEVLYAFDQPLVGSA